MVSVRIVLVALLGVICIAQATAQRNPTYTSRASGIFRVLTLKDEGAGRISGVITQPNAVFNLSGQRDDLGNRFTGVISSTDAPNVRQNFELRRSGSTVTFFFIRPDTGKVDSTTRTLYRASAVNTGMEDEENGIDDGFTEPSYPADVDAPALPQGGDEFSGVFRGSTSTMTLRPTDKPRTYIGTLQQNGRSFPVTVTNTPRIAGTYYDSAGRKRIFSAQSPTQDRIVIEVNGRKETLQRDDNEGQYGDLRESEGEVEEGTTRRDDIRNRYMNGQRKPVPNDSGLEDDGFDNGTQNDGLRERNGNIGVPVPARPRATPSRTSARRPTQRISQVAGQSKELGRHVN